jgi:tetratricopeptide (TPR) repeat protein
VKKQSVLPCCIWLLCFGLAVLNIYGQKKKNDSLLSVYNDSRQADTSRLKAINDLASYLINNNPDSAILIANQAIQSAEKANQLKYKAISLMVIGITNFYRGNYSKAMDFFSQALEINKETNNKSGEAACYDNMGGVYNYQSDYPKALEYYLKSQKILEGIGDQAGLGGNYNNLGVVYNALEQFDKSLEYHLKALKIKIKSGNKIAIANSYLNIGFAYQGQVNYPKALENYLNALKMSQEAGNKRGIGNSYAYVGGLYTVLADYPKALKYLFNALAIDKEIDDRQAIGSCYNAIGEIENKLNKSALAIQYLDSGLDVNKSIGDILQENDSYHELSTAYSNSGHFKEALDYFVKYKTLTDSIFTKDKIKQLGDIQTRFEVDKKETEMKLLAREEKKRQQLIIFSVAAMLVIVLVFFVFLYRRFKITQAQNIIIEKQKQLVETQRQEMIDSITYAKRLQQAILPPLMDIQRSFSHSFVLYIPKDIVAGDFYWMHKTDETLIIAVADCTGHGVPGALVSVVCSNALNRSVKEFGLLETGRILDKVSELVLETFEKSGEEIRDGMDISLLSINRKSNQLEWSGANNPLWIIKGSQLTEIKPDKQPIGKTENRKWFTTHVLDLVPGETIYLITDGYADQFGKAKKKLMKKKFKEMLISIQDKSMPEQENFLRNHHLQWKGNMEQTDDITIIGIKL